MNTIVVTIGRNVGDKPMGHAAWRSYKLAVLDVLRDADCIIIQRPTTGDVAVCSQLGVWDSVTEDCAAYTAFATDAQVATLREWLTVVRRHYGQDGIAFIAVPGTHHII